jgi:hypothetical protein
MAGVELVVPNLFIPIVKFRSPAVEPRVNGRGLEPTLYHLLLLLGAVELLSKIVIVGLGISIAGGSGKLPKGLPSST